MNIKSVENTRLNLQHSLHDYYTDIIGLATHETSLTNQNALFWRRIAKKF